VGFFSDASFIGHGFLLSGGQYTTLDDPNGVFGTSAYGINSRGDIVGAFSDSNALHGFLLSGGQYTTLDVPNAAGYTIATGINARGQVVGQYIDADFNLHGFLLSGGHYTTIDDPNGIPGSTAAWGINSRGDIVGSFSDASFKDHGFLLSGGQYTTLDVPNAVHDVLAFGINDHGQIVGEYFGANFLQHGFLLSGGQYTTLDDPNAGTGFGQGSGAGGISDSGKIVGGYFDANDVEHAFLATPSQPSSVRIALSSPGGHPGHAGVLGRRLPLKPASLDHARLLGIQVNIEEGGFGVVLGQGLGRTVPGPITTIVTVPSSNGDTTGRNGQDSDTRILSAAATRSKDLNAIEYDVFDRNDNPLDPGLFVL
jgi:uncharacterized membrane protein